MLNYDLTHTPLLFAGQMRNDMLVKPGRTNLISPIGRLSRTVPQNNHHRSIIANSNKVEISETWQAGQ